MPQYTDTTVNSLVINKLTKAQYEALDNPSDTELYLVPDEIDTTPTSGSENLISSGAVYNALQNKADKVQGAINGNFAGLDSTGNLTDSGKKPSDFLTQHQHLPEYTIQKLGTAETGYIASYRLLKDNVQEGATINIPKDYLVKSGSIVDVVLYQGHYYESTDTGHTTPLDAYGVNSEGKYLKFVVNTVEGTGTESSIYISVSDLVDVYTAGNGIDISNSNVVSVKIDTANANGLATTSAGLKLGVAQGSTGGAGGSAGAMSAADKEKLDGIEAGAEANVQSDWEQDDNTADDFIKHKPTIGNGTVTINQGGELKGTFTMNQSNDTVINLGQGIASVGWDDVTGKPEFADVATSGDYNDLINSLTEGNGIDISSSNVVSVEIDTANANGLATTSAGLKLDVAQASTGGAGGSAGAMSAVDKEKLDSIETGAEANVIEAVKVSGTALQVTNKAVNIETGTAYDPSTNKIATMSDVTGAMPNVGSLNTNNTSALTPSASESFGGSISLHKVSKTGSYDDLNNKPSIPPDMSEMSYGHSTWNDFITAYETNSVVYCKASSNSNPASGSQTRKAFLAYVNNDTNPTEVEFQYYRSVVTHSDSQQGDQVFVYKLTPANGGTWTVIARNTFTKVVAGANMSSSYSNGTITLNSTPTDISGKADKVQNATSGNFAGLDSNGNLTDSEHNADELVPSGGTTGQVLAKHSNTDNDVEWVTPEDVEMLVPIEYSDLVTLKTGGNLVPGVQYRITDYTCTTTQTNTSSASHVFDIIVTADSETELSEIARAAHHSGDTYFANCDLDAWELKYCLENDTDRFAWADSTNGKGVVYYMKDEYSNECPYDFKNILTNVSNDSYYTFDALVNSIHYDLSVAQELNNCYGNTICEYYVYTNSLYKLKLGGNIFSNTSLSLSCHSNLLGNNCNGNSFGDNCYSNTFGNNCYSNTFGNICYNNSFGDSCHGNSFGDNCYSNTFGNNCYSNTFGNSFQKNSFGNNCNSSVFGNYCQAITVFNNVGYCSITGGTNGLPVKNAQILNGTRGAGLNSKLTITFAQDKDYTQVAGLVNGTNLRIWIAEDEVTGPTTATDNHIALFDGTTGKVIKDSGISVSDLSPDLCTPITYSELKALRDGGDLVPGMRYRITDYNTTVSEDLTDVSVAEHQFDIVVTALSENELDHCASAIQHEGDTYFSECDLSKWKLWYDIENDTEKYSWAVGDSSSNGGAKGSIPEYAPEYIYSDYISGILDKAGLSTALVFQGMETITLKEEVECYVYGTSVQATALGYTKIFCQECPSVKEPIYAIDNKGNISSISRVETVSSSKQPTNGTKIIAKAVTSDHIASILGGTGISAELEFNGRIVMYRGQNCYSYGSSAQYAALANDFHTVSNIIVEDGVSPIAKKASDVGTHVIILDIDVTDPITAVSQETVVVGGNSGGTGVIYRMIDEWSNDCSYDFKNIMFSRSGDVYYTFDVLVDSVHYDLSVAQTENNCYGNIIKSFLYKNGNISKYSLSRNIFKNTELTSLCNSNILNNNCRDNIFGTDCYYNTFGTDCYDNAFGDGCQSNTFGDNCNSNSFGNNCSSNSFGNHYYSNSFGNYCQYNLIGNICTNNTFGNYCQYNTFGNKFVSSSFGSYCQDITVFDNVQYCNVTNGTNSLPVKNAQILNGTKGTSSSSRLVITFTANQDYTQVAGLVNGTTLRIWIAEDTVTGPTTSTNNRIAVFDGTTGKVIKDGGVTVADLQVEVPEYTIQKLGTAETGYIASYRLLKDNVQEGATINIPKDYLVKSGSIVDIVLYQGHYYESTDTGHTTPLDAYGVNSEGKYLKFVVNTVEGTGDESCMYISVSDLVDVYTAGNGIDISNYVVSVKIDTANANGLATTSAGLKLGVAQASTGGAGGSAGAMSAADKEKLDNLVSPTECYWANQSVQSSASYATAPEFQQVTINGDSTATQASTDHCVIVYDTTNKCLKFTF